MPERGRLGCRFMAERKSPGKSKKRGPKPKSSKDEGTKQKLIAATARHLAEYGPRGTEVGAVCKELDLSPSLVNYYFDGPDQLIWQAALHDYSEHIEMQRKALERLSLHLDVFRVIVECRLPDQLIRSVEVVVDEAGREVQLLANRADLGPSRSVLGQVSGGRRDQLLLRAFVLRALGLRTALFRFSGTLPLCHETAA